MSSMPQKHCLELRDWYGVQTNLSAGEELVNRIHLPCYEELCGKVYYRAFNTISMVVRTFLPDETYIYPELENGSFSNYTKDARFVRFQLESSIPLLPVGMTYDIYDFVGNGAIESFSYGEAVQSVTPYLQGVVDLNLHFSDLCGVCLPIDEKSAKRKLIQRGWEDLIEYQEMEIGGYLSGLGVNCKWTAEKKLCREVVLLTAGSVNNFTDGEIVVLFENNYIIADGSAVLALKERGLEGLLGIKTVELCKADSGLQTYEQAVKDFVVEKKAFYRASSLAKAGDYVKIEYAHDVRVYSELYTSEREYFGIGAVKTDKFAVIPYILKGDLYEQYNPLRRAFIYEVLKIWQKGYVQTGVCGLHPYTYRKGKDSVLMLINTTVNEYEKIEFSTNLNFTEISVVMRNGKIQKVSFERNGEKVSVALSLEYLSTATLLLKA